MFGLQNVQPTSRNSAAHLSTKQDDFTSIFSKALILKEILCRSVAKTEKWTTLVHFSDDFVSFDRYEFSTLWWNLNTVSGYLRNNAHTLVNYGARHRKGLPISSSIARPAPTNEQNRPCNPAASQGGLTKSTSPTFARSL